MSAWTASAHGSSRPRPRRRSLRLFEKPEPVILAAGAVVVAHLEAAAPGHGAGAVFIEGDAEPGIAGLVVARVSLHLELEQCPRPQQPVHFADVALDDLVAGDVLEYDVGEREIELQPAAQADAVEHAGEARAAQHR